MIVRIVLIALVESKNLGTIRTTGTGDVGGFGIIVSIASKTRDAESSVMFLGMTRKFCTCVANKPNIYGGF